MVVPGGRATLAPLACDVRPSDPQVLVWAQLALFLVAATCACCGFPLLVLVVALGRNAKDQGPDSGAGDAGNESFRAVGEPTWSEAPDHAAMLAGTGSRRDADP